MLLSLDTPRRMPAEVDLTLLWSSLILLLIGMVMVYSASIAFAEEGHFTGNRSAYFLIRHGVFLGVGLVNLQPSELMKLFAVLYAADYTVRKMPHMHDLKKAFLPMAGAMVLVGIMLLKEPDFGAFVVIISIAIGILFLGGMRARRDRSRHSC